MSIRVPFGRDFFISSSACKLIIHIHTYTYLAARETKLNKKDSKVTLTVYNLHFLFNQYISPDITPGDTESSNGKLLVIAETEHL